MRLYSFANTDGKLQIIARIDENLKKPPNRGDRHDLSLSLLSHVSSSNETVRSSSGRKIQMRIVAKDQNSRPSLDELSEFKKSDSDTGSASLQIALLTKRIENLTRALASEQKRLLHATRIEVTSRPTRAITKVFGEGRSGEVSNDHERFGVEDQVCLIIL